MDGYDSDSRSQGAVQQLWRQSEALSTEQAGDSGKVPEEEDYGAAGGTVLHGNDPVMESYSRTPSHIQAYARRSPREVSAEEQELLSRCKSLLTSHGRATDGNAAGVTEGRTRTQTGHGYSDFGSTA